MSVLWSAGLSSCLHVLHTLVCLSLTLVCCPLCLFVCTQHLSVCPSHLSASFYLSILHTLLDLTLSVCLFPRAEEEGAARAKLEKENRELHAQLQEVQDDFESEKEARHKVEKQRRQLNEELENLRDSLEESESSTAAQQEIRAQRENEVAQLKKTLDEETSAHEAAVASMRSKHTKAIEDLNEQLEALRKVGGAGGVVLGECEEV